MENYKSLLMSISRGLSSNIKDECNRTPTHRSSRRVLRSAEEEFQEVRRWLARHDYDIGARNVDWKGLKTFLVGKRNFLLRLLENPNLLEHESFTDVLWAVFHLTEELGARVDLQGLPDEDYQHLYGDVKRVYGQLARQWLEYMKHLKGSYPYLFSLALRTNPFNRNASPVLRKK